MKYLFSIFFFIPLFLFAQETICFTSPLSEYISDSHQFENIDRTITLRDSTITILSRDKGTTDIQTWIITEKFQQGSDFLFRCTSIDKKYPSTIKVFDYAGKVERIEVLQENQIIRFHID